MDYVNNAQEFMKACEKEGCVKIFLNCDISVPDYELLGKENLTISAGGLTKLEIKSYCQSGRGQCLELDGIHLIIMGAEPYSGLYFSPQGEDVFRLVIHNTCKIDGLIWHRGNITVISGDDLIFTNGLILADGNGIMIQNLRTLNASTGFGIRVRNEKSVLTIENSTVFVKGLRGHPGIDLRTYQGGKQGAKLVVKNAILIAAGGDCAPGIGVSDNYSRGSIEICGSTVDAVGGDGTAECGPGAGIGSAGMCISDRLREDDPQGCMELVIKENSIVTAAGGNSISDEFGSAAGIGSGGGFRSSPPMVDSVTIENATVDVKAGEGKIMGAGIGGGGCVDAPGGSLSNVTIRNSFLGITCAGEQAYACGAGIGGGASETKNGGNAENIVVEDTVLAVEFSGIERESGVVGGGTSCCGSTGTAVYKLKNSTLKGKKEEIHEAQR